MFVVKDDTRDVSITFTSRREAFAFFDRLTDKGNDATLFVYWANGDVGIAERVKHETHNIGVMR